jgi:hypothetical protein
MIISDPVHTAECHALRSGAAFSELDSQVPIDEPDLALVIAGMMNVVGLANGIEHNEKMSAWTESHHLLNSIFRKMRNSAS